MKKNLFLILFLYIFLMKCDRIYPPFITNLYNHEIELIVIYEDKNNINHSSKRFVLTSNASYGGGTERITFLEISVFFSNDSSLKYLPIFLNKQRKEIIHDQNDEHWILCEKGLFLIPKEYKRKEREYIKLQQSNIPISEDM
jgi:hypothetical protein